MLLLRLPRFPSSASLLLLAAMVAPGCASGGDMGPGGGDSDGAVGGDSGRSDGSLPRLDGGRRDAGAPVECDVREHLCGTTCEIDGMNDPATGCMNTCDGMPCPTPEFGVATCSMAGDCDWDCMEPYVRMGDTCTCEPRTCASAMAECGPLDDGCGGMADCGLCEGGGTCTDNVCGCAPDRREPNDSHTATTSIATLEDCADSSYSIIDANIDEPGDTDWFRFEVSDCGDGGNPVITVTLDGIPTGADYDLAAYYACSEDSDQSSCNRGTVDNTVGNGCASITSGEAVETVEIATDCSGFDTTDSGALFIHVTPRTTTAMCATYRIQIAVR